MINVNMDKAKEIWKDQLRLARKPILESLDTEYMKALESGSNTSVIVEKKQELRDITIHPDLISASTPEELKTFWPDILNK